MATPEVRLINNVRKDLPEIKILLLVRHVYLHYSLPRTPLDPPPMPRPSLSSINDLKRKNRGIKLRHSNPRLEESGDVKQCAVGLQNLLAKWASSKAYKFTFIRLCQTNVRKLFTLPLTSYPQSKVPAREDDRAKVYRRISTRGNAMGLVPAPGWWFIDR